MHEASLIRTLIAQVAELLSPYSGATLRRIRIQVGPLSCVEPALLISAWEQHRESGVDPMATLEIDEVPLVARCHTCAADFEPVKFCFRCPRCGGSDTKAIAGDGVMLQSIEIEEASHGTLR